MADEQREQAKQALRDWAAQAARRDELIRAAAAAGVSVWQIHRLTGLARTTIARILTKG